MERILARTARTGFLIALTVVGLFFPQSSIAFWQHNGNPVCTVFGRQEYPCVASDCQGGIIVVWQDQRNGNGDIYAQRVSSNGDTLWKRDGAVICAASADQWYPEIVSDSAGGGIIAWWDYRGGKWELYAQRVNSDGIPQWSPDGNLVCSEIGWTGSVPGMSQVVSDGYGGAIIVWCDNRNSNPDIYAQRLDPGGHAVWSAGGVAICTAMGDQFLFQVVADVRGGAFLTWTDYRNINSDIYAQRIDVMGESQWLENGVPLCTNPEYQWRSQLASDSRNGAIISWWDFRRGNGDIFAQRIDSSGAPLWELDGLPVCEAPGDQGYYNLGVVSDSAGSAIMLWEDYRNSNWDIFAQKIDINGKTQWTTDGVSVCTAPGDQGHHYQGSFALDIVSDRRGGAIVAWIDGRSGELDIYAQRIDYSGVPRWAVNGASVCMAGGNQDFPKTTPDGSGGSFIVWADGRTDSLGDVYVQHINSDGPERPTPIAIVSASGIGRAGYAVISWQMAVDVPAASSFRIERSETPDGHYTALELDVVKDSQYSFSCIDRSVSSDKTYWYRIVLVGPSGEDSYGPIEVHVESVPVAYQVYQSYPNPFNPVCTIRYDIPRAGKVSLSVFDVSGSFVRTLVDGWREPGVYSEIWDGKGDAGNALASGVYLCSIEAGDFVATRKIVMLR